MGIGLFTSRNIDNYSSSDIRTIRGEKVELGNPLDQPIKNKNPIEDNSNRAYYFLFF